MAATGEIMSIAEFRTSFGRDDQRYEYWDGKAVPKSMPTWVHGFLQIVLGQLLREVGYKPASEVELRIVPDYRPKPDVIATKKKLEQPYPTSALEVVVEILSEEDVMEYVLNKCERYLAWGFQLVYVVDPAARRVYQWSEGGLMIVSELAGIASTRIWAMLDE